MTLNKHELRMVRGSQMEEPELTKFERDLVGGPRRITVYPEPHLLDLQIRALEDLVITLKGIHRDPNSPTRTRMFAVTSAVMSCADIIKAEYKATKAGSTE